MVHKYKGFKQSMANYHAQRRHIPQWLGEALAEAGIDKTKAAEIIDLFFDKRYIIESHYKKAFKFSARFAYEGEIERQMILAKNLKGFK